MQPNFLAKYGTGLCAVGFGILTLAHVAGVLDDSAYKWLLGTFETIMGGSTMVAKKV